MSEIFKISDYDIVFSGLKEGEHEYSYKIRDTFLKILSLMSFHRSI